MATRARRKRQAWKQPRQQKTQEMNTTHEPYLACGHPMRRGTSATLQTALTTWAVFTGLLQALQKGWAHLVRFTISQTSSWGSSRELCGKLRRSRQPGEEGTEGRLRAATSPSAPLRPPLLAPVARGRAAPPLPTLVRPNAYAAAQDRTTEGESWGGVRRPDRFPEGLGEALRDLVRQGGTRNGAVGGALPPAQHGRGPGPLSSTGGLRGQAWVSQEFRDKPFQKGSE